METVRYDELVRFIMSMTGTSVPVLLKPQVKSVKRRKGSAHCLSTSSSLWIFAMWISRPARPLPRRCRPETAGCFGSTCRWINILSMLLRDGDRTVTSSKPSRHLTHARLCETHFISHVVSHGIAGNPTGSHSDQPSPYPNDGSSQHAQSRHHRAPEPDHQGAWGMKYEAGTDAQ